MDLLKLHTNERCWCWCCYFYCPYRCLCCCYCKCYPWMSRNQNIIHGNPCLALIKGIFHRHWQKQTYVLINMHKCDWVTYLNKAIQLRTAWFSVVQSNLLHAQVINSLVLCEDSIFNTLHHEDVRLVIDCSGNNP